MIGVAGDDEAAATVVAALDDDQVTAGPAARLADAELDAVVAVGESALVDLVIAGIDVPVLPVSLAEGLPSTAVAGVPRALEAYGAGEAPTRRHPLLAVEAAGEPAGPAAFDAMLVRSDPGRISEFRLSAPETRSRFRADGVVAATPAGSHGYAHATGGPRLALDADAVVVVPVAAFGLGAPTWVLDPEAGLELQVARDEGDVSLLVDGRVRRTLSGRATVRLAAGGGLETIEPPTD